MKNEATTLTFVGGGSDKVYHVMLQKIGSGWNVSAEYGRRGSSMTHVDKGSYAHLVDAQLMYARLIKEKRAKGYHITSAGAGVPAALPAAAVPEKEDTGIIVSLLNPITNPEDYIEDDEFVMQQKFDGERRVLKRSASIITGANRKGLVVPVPGGISSALMKMHPDEFIMDGEIVGTNYYAFDLLEIAGNSIRKMPYHTRLSELENLFPAVHSLNLVETYADAADKHAAFKRLQEEQAEGVVFKRINASYVEGRPASAGDYVKFKFWDSASVLVSAHTKGKRSVEMQMRDGFNIVDVGRVTIPPNHAVPPVGVIIEVRYLYAYKGGSLYQPTYLGERVDLTITDTDISQLKYTSK